MYCTEITRNNHCKGGKLSRHYQFTGGRGFTPAAFKRCIAPPPVTSFRSQTLIYFEPKRSHLAVLAQVVLFWLAAQSGVSYSAISRVATVYPIPSSIPIADQNASGIGRRTVIWRMPAFCLLARPFFLGVGPTFWHSFTYAFIIKRTRRIGQLFPGIGGRRRQITLTPWLWRQIY